MTQDPDINFWLKDAPVTQPTVGQEAEPMGVEATVTLTLGGELTDIDASIAPLVQALNAAGFMTIASCSGHAQRPGSWEENPFVVAVSFSVERRNIDA